MANTLPGRGCTLSWNCQDWWALYPRQFQTDLPTSPVFTFTLVKKHRLKARRRQEVAHRIWFSQKRKDLESSEEKNPVSIKEQIDASLELDHVGLWTLQEPHIIIWRCSLYILWQCLEGRKCMWSHINFNVGIKRLTLKKLDFIVPSRISLSSSSEALGPCLERIFRTPQTQLFKNK